MDVFLMIRRRNQTIMLDATEETTVLQIKKNLEAILKKDSAEQQLYKLESKEPLDDGRTLGDCGFKSSNSKAQDPASIGLRFKEGDDFEGFTIDPYSVPPDLPDVMKEGGAPGGSKE